MTSKIIYLIIPLMVFSVALIGSFFTGTGMDWYQGINLPEFTPPGSFIGLVWTLIFILTAISILFALNKNLKERKNLVISFFVINLLLNLSWSFLFFNQHLIGLALIDAILLALSVLILMVLIWPFSKFSSLLLLPYFLWVSFASYLNFIIWQLNI